MYVGKFHMSRSFEHPSLSTLWRLKTSEIHNRNNARWLKLIITVAHTKLRIASASFIIRIPLVSSEPKLILAINRESIMIIEYKSYFEKWNNSTKHAIWKIWRVGRWYLHSISSGNFTKSTFFFEEIWAF